MGRFRSRWILLVALLGSPAPAGPGAEEDPAQEAELVAAYRSEVARFGSDAPEVAAPLCRLADFYSRTGRDAQAEPCQRRALAIVEARGGFSPVEVARLRDKLIRQVYKRGDRREASVLMTRNLKDDEVRLGPADPLVRTRRANLAKLQVFFGFDQDAEILYRKNLEILEARPEPDDLELADVLDSIGTVNLRLLRYEPAEAQFKRCLRIREAKLPVGDWEIADASSDLAGLYYAMARYHEAEPCYRRALAIRRAGRGADHPHQARDLHDLAWLLKATGRYGESETLHRQALEIRRHRLELDRRVVDNRRDVADSLNGLASLYEQMGRHDEAEPLFRESIAILEDVLDPKHPDVALGLTKLALLLKDQRRFAQAEPLCCRGLAIREERLGANDPATGRSLAELGSLYAAMGRYAEAESADRRSLAILEVSRGRDHPHVAASLAGLGAVLEATGRAAEAESAHRRALGILEARFGPDHPDVAAGLTRLALIDAGRGRWDRATDEADRARRILQRHVSKTLPDLLEPDQLAFLRAQDRPSLHEVVAMASGHPDDRRLVEASAAWVLNGKAVAHRAMAGRALLLREAGDPSRVKLARELLAARTGLASMSLVAPEPGREEASRREFDRLKTLERDLSARLGPPERPSADEGWVDLASVRAGLRRDSVLIELLKYQAGLANFTRDPSRYGAWIIPATGAGPVRLVDLGPARAIDDAVAALARLTGPPDQKELQDEGDGPAEARTRQASRSLAKLVLDPILGHVQGASRWVISPDASLWLVPWSALVLPDGRYLIEAHTLQQVVTGRVLGGPPAEPRSDRRPLVLADPDFDRKPTGHRAPSVSPLAAPAIVEDRPLGRVRLPGRASRLAGTLAEARAIEPLLATYAGARPLVYTGGDALESVFKQTDRPRVLSISTHGFALTGSSTGPGATNPLLQCGLLLAGANRGEEAALLGEEDGILTGLEVVGVNLRGTELVVLSACQTGLGTVRDGEGIAGLRQAFELAGAGAVVASLWSVDDRSTAQLMKSLFEALQGGKLDKAESLRRAQLDLIDRRRSDYNVAHPHYWAAFALTGRE